MDGAVGDGHERRRPRGFALDTEMGKRAKDTEQRDDDVEPLEEDPGRLGQLSLQRSIGVDLRQAFLDWAGVDADPDRLVDQGALVGKDAEDGALGYAGSFCHLTGGDCRTPLDQEGDDRLDDGPTTVVRRKGLGPMSAAHVREIK